MLPTSINPVADRIFSFGCMGRVRGFPFDVVIGVGGINGQSTQQGIAGKSTGLGVVITPRRSAY